MSKVLSIAILAVVAAACDADESCTLVGCVDPFSIEFEHTFAPESQYTVYGDVDGLDFRCEVRLPYEQGPSNACDQEWVLLQVQQNPRPDENWRLSHLRFENQPPPASVSVSVAIDGNDRWYEEFHPIYSTSEPNGPSCGPRCTNASVVMQLSE